jgi:hypothetical protein
MNPKEQVMMLQLPTIYVPSNTTNESTQDPSGMISDLMMNATGFIPQTVSPLTKIYASPGVTSEITYVYIARDLVISSKEDEALKSYQLKNNITVETWNTTMLYKELKKASASSVLFHDAVTVSALSQLLLFRVIHDIISANHL